MNRYEELDSLRGLAALTVVFSHFMLVFNFNSTQTFELGYVENWFKHSPLHIFWAGHEAVILFFILSGFVLSMPFLAKSRFSYPGYVVKRIFRISVPLSVSIIIATLLYYGFQGYFKNGNSKWVNNLWTDEFTIIDVLNHLFLIGTFQADINPVIWSLVHELRISLLFPVIVYVVIKLKWKHSLLFAFLLSLSSCFLMRIFPDFVVQNLLYTGHYTAMFIVGSVLAKYRLELTSKIKEMSLIRKFILLIIGILSYTFSWLFSEDSVFYNIITMEWAITLGASIFILMCLSSTTISNILKTNVALFFGKISYSLYLYHLIFLIVIVKLDVLPIYGGLLLTFIVSIAVATLSHSYIEKPFVKFGKLISERLEKESVRTKVPKAS